MTLLPDLADRLADVARRGGVPGAAVAVRHGDTLAEAATGVLNISTGVEATTDSLFHIGSVTKMYTALLVMQLVEEGRLDLDEPIRRRLPEFRLADGRAAAAVTARHLLTHTGGFDGDLFDDTGRGDDCLDRYLAVVGGARQFAAPGELFSYCNSGYVVLGALVARLRADTWEAVVRDRLLAPMSLDHTTLSAEEAIVFRAAPRRGTSRIHGTGSRGRAIGGRRPAPSARRSRRSVRRRATWPGSVSCSSTAAPSSRP
ncbi:serine hydrolase domain-containing protein [Longispora urticae]